MLILSCRACHCRRPNRTPMCLFAQQHVRWVIITREVSPRSASLFWPSAFWNGLSSTCARWGQHTCRADWTKERYLSRSNVPSEWMPIRRWFRRSGRPLARQNRPFASKDNSHCPTYYSKDKRWPTIGPTSSFMHSPRSPCFHRSSGVSGNRVTRCYWWPPCGGTNLGCQSWLSYWQQLPGPCPWDGSPLSGERNNMAPSTRAVGSLHLAAQWEPTGFPERVLTPFLRLEPRLRDPLCP